MPDLSLYEVDLDTQRPNPFDNTKVLRGDSPRTAFSKYNDALNAIAGGLRHSGPLAPFPTQPYMIWYDTSVNPPVERIRNGANTAWLLKANNLGLSLLGVLGSEAELPETARSGDSYVIGENVWTWVGGEWENMGPIRGPEGPVGPQGEQGEMGIGLTPRGNVPTIEDLPSDPELGDAYSVGGVLHAWDGTDWVNMGQFQGPPGEQGAPGANGLAGQDGANGLSAYEVAVENGFTGTEAEWLESLKGEPGSGTGGGLGQFMFAVEDGNLILYYSEGETPPNFEIVDGELVYTF